MAEKVVYSEDLTVWWENAADEAYERKMIRYTDLAAEVKQQGLKAWEEVEWQQFVAKSTWKQSRQQQGTLALVAEGKIH